MKVRLGALLFVIMLAIGLVAATVAVAGQAADATDSAEEETQREQVRAAAEAAAGPVSARSSALVATTTLTAPLFVGLDDLTLFTYAIDPDTSAHYPLFDGFEVWGAAYDRQNEIVYMADGSQLVAWPIGGTPASLGTMFAGGPPTTTMNFVGLAFYGGTLYGTRNIGNGPALPEAVYTIDTTTLEATLAFTYSIGADAADIGGFDAHPFTGVLYGTNDDTDLQGLVQLDRDGTITLIAPYPVGQTDIDGLAIGSDNRAYLITDQPGFFYVFDFDTMTYTAPITNPWTTAEVFAGGAWVTGPITTGLTLTKTVGLDVNTCATTDEVAVISGTLVTYCYYVTNTGNVELNLHDVIDSQLGDLLEDFPLKMEPLASLFFTETAVITQSIVNTATWTAFNLGPLDVISATDTAEVTVVEPAITLSKTVGLNPNECATGNELTVSDGTEVTYCYRVTNTGDITFTKHDLVDSYFGTAFIGADKVLSPTETFFVTDTLQITQTIVNTATWTAYNSVPADGAMSTAVATVTLGLPSPPDIAVNPQQLSATIMTNSVVTATLTISNTGETPLNWTITEASPTCAAPTALTWAEANPPAGTTPAGGQSTVTVTFDSTGLAPGPRLGALCFTSNDVDEPLVEVPLALDVAVPPSYDIYLAVIYGSPDDR